MASISSTRILVVGLGGVGSIYSHMFKSAGAHLSVVARSNFEAIKKNNGMQFNSKVHGSHLIKPDAIYNSAKSIEKENANFDYIVCTNKALEPANFPGEIESAVSDKTSIVLIQNGVGAETYMRQKYKNNSIITCVAYVSAGLDGPSTASQVSKEKLLIGAYDDKCDMAKIDLLEQILKKAGSNAKKTDKIYTEKWRKVAVNVAFNGLTALTHLYTHEMLSSSDVMPTVAKRLIGDVIKVAQAEGHDLSEDECEKFIPTWTSIPSVRSSMYNDVDSGKPMEVEVIFGKPVELSKKHGLYTPTLDTVYALVKGLDNDIRSRL